MAHALETISESTILRTHPLLRFQKGPFSYKIERVKDQSIYTVSDRTQSLAVPLKYALGLGSAGQTYVFEKDGALYESYVSYYKEIDGLDVTLGGHGLHPTTLVEAAGRLLGERDLILCFGCHSTNSIIDGKFDQNRLVPGVQCERCHGNLNHHLEGLKKGDAKLGTMEDFRNFTAEESAHFCGQCHRTWEQIASDGPRGAANVRFQPYRLTNSKCFDPDDKRIACTTCHDPHLEIDRVSSHYDAKCESCHGGGKSGAKICKVAARDCASCHMPKVELAGGHHRFTDHEIRIVKPGELYPD